jgi:ribose 5-phosphate isomerase
MVVKNSALKTQMKTNACVKAIEFLPEKGKIGLGSGSTVDLFAEMIPKKSKLKFFCVSEKAYYTLKGKGLSVSKKIQPTDIAFDGADNILSNSLDGKSELIAIKGAGALDFVEEKKLDYSSKKLVLLVDKNKLASSNKIIIFVEVENGKEIYFIERMKMFGYKTKEVSKDNPHLENKKNKFVYITISGEENLNELEEHIECVSGVKGCGIFSKKRFTLIIGNKKGAKVI